MTDVDTLCQQLADGTLEVTMLDGLDLSGRELAGIEVEKILFQRVCLAGADLRGAKFRDCVFFDCDLAGADCTGARFAGVSCVPGQCEQRPRGRWLKYFAGSGRRGAKVKS